MHEVHSRREATRPRASALGARAVMFIDGFQTAANVVSRRPRALGSARAIGRIHARRSWPWAAFIVLFVLSFSRSRAAHGWTLAEHSAIGASGVQALAPAPLGLAQLWDEALSHYRYLLPLCEGIAHSSATVSDDRCINCDICIAFADLPALAADHSCSPSDLHGTLLAAATEMNLGSSRRSAPHWLFRVIMDARASHQNLSRVGGFPRTEASDRYLEDRDDNRDDLNFDLAKHDPAYVDRASANYAHFQLPRSADGETFEAWLARMVDPAVPLANAASYAAYHVAALRLAEEYGEAVRAGTLTATDRADRAWRILLYEAFALHFLEDAFAAGHFVDFFRESPFRNGTHDYYCSHGATATSWDGTTRRAYGDAHMDQGDLAAAAAAVRASLEMVQAALAPGAPGLPPLPERGPAFREPDVCTARSPPPWLAAVPALPQLAAVMRQAPRPSVRRPRDANMPEYRNDRGINLQLAVRAQGQYDTFGADNGEDQRRFRLLGEAGFAINFDSVMSGYRDGNIIQIAGLAGYEWGSDSGPSYGFRVRLPLFSFLYSALRISLGSEVRSDVLTYTGMVETRGVSFNTGPWTSMVAFNLFSEVSVLWGPRGTTVQLPIFYYLMRGNRPSHGANDFSVRLEVGASAEFAGSHDTYFGLFVGLNPIYRHLLSNLGPQ